MLQEGKIPIRKKSPHFLKFFQNVAILYMRESTNNSVTKKISRYGKEQYSRDTAQGRTTDAS
jgi:hypothetical protein